MAARHFDKRATFFTTLGTIMHFLPPGAPTPFFDRFTARPDASSGVHLTLTEALQLSLQLDLTRLFNVRNALTIDRFLSGAPTALDYGLPDTLHLLALSNTDLQRWELVVARAIALYEPRLQQVRVVVTPDPARPTVARVTIMALAAVGEQLRQFQFEAGLDGRQVGASHA